MIYVDRKTLAAPTDLVREGQQKLRLLRAELKRTKFRQRDPTFSESVYASDTVQKALTSLFERRCAFCETPIEKVDWENVGHFRPPSRAADLPGRVSPLHYWWLAYEWENLYLMCRLCKKHKATRFPVRQSRAPSESRGEALLKEEPRLLDPCRDAPEEHLRFDATGRVLSISPRGEITIEVFALNRPDLVDARQSYAQRVQEALPSLHEHGLSVHRLENALIRRSRSARWGGRRFFALTRQLARTAVQRKATGAVRKGSPSRQPDGAAGAPSGAHPPTESAGWLQKIEIENFRALQHLKLEFPTANPTWALENLGSGEQEPWIVLLGNNGIGKSSVLKAIALALAPPRDRKRLVHSQAELVTRGRGQRSGRVRLWFSNRNEPHEWVFGRASSRTLAPPSPAIGMPVLGYGSTRLLPPSRLTEAKRAPNLTRTGNLFSATEPLSDAERWLASTKLVRPEEFNLLATDLKELLAMDAKDSLMRNRFRLLAQLYRKKLAVRELSDGFQSVLALALDMMFNFSVKTHDVRNVEALVLIDEIEVHLHPTWKFRIVRELRKMFRRSRFIVTTHDPLCLQGLAPGELHVMTRDPRSRAVKVSQVDVPLGLRADQVLTGEWFGMGSTRDPDTLKLMGRHSQLLLIGDRSAELESEKRAIETTLRERLGRFGDSPYERAGLQAYAELASKSAESAPKVDPLEISKRIRELLPMEHAPE